MSYWSASTSENRSLVPGGMVTVGASRQNRRVQAIDPQLIHHPRLLLCPAHLRPGVQRANATFGFAPTIPALGFAVVMADGGQRPHLTERPAAGIALDAEFGRARDTSDRSYVRRRAERPAVALLEGR